jgi:3-oxoacyl-[acyl-carrier protein] reductase
MSVPESAPAGGLPQFSLSGRVALVTGSSLGLGKAMALALGAAGAKVAINYFNRREPGEAALRELQSRGGTGMLCQADVTDADSVQKLVASVAAELGPIDILVPNATCDQPQRPIEEYDWDFYQSMIDFFIKSPYLLTRAGLAHMKEARRGRIINIGSEVFQRGVGNFSAYVAAKGGQNGWTRSMASELAPFGITVNMISPGWIPVERHDQDPQELKDSYRALIPVERWGVPQDLEGAVVFLASDSSSFITGQNLHINGGMTVG